MNFQDYIKTELMLLIPVLYFAGIGLKKSKLPDRWIPTTLGLLAVVLSAVWVIATTDVSSIQEIASAIFTAVTQGILLAGTSVYVNQLYVQAKKEE
ncbi:MAG: phage holin family protein [Oscillospiraceae bacterium]|nr:phage holin family protein [Oscillospiraceae bacterium]